METHLVLKAVQSAMPDGRSRTDLPEVFNALAEQLPRLKTDPDRWDTFIELLIAAETEGLIVLPSRRGIGWNQDLVPARPQWVGLPPAKSPSEVFNHRGFP